MTLPFPVPYGPGDVCFEKIGSEYRVDAAATGLQATGFQFLSFDPPPDRIRMLMKKAGSFLDRNDVFHGSKEYSIPVQ